MMRSLRLSLSVFVYIFGAIFLPLVISQADVNDAYYWKDFNGSIPYDAIPAGKDKNGTTTYIGQAYHTITGSLIPGQIDSNQEVLIYHYDAKVYKVSRNVKILCSLYPNNFEWIKTNDIDLRFLTQKHLIPGGFDEEYPLLIGRAPKGVEIVVGKVTVYHNYKGFQYVLNGEAPHEHDYYEVLSYNPKCKAEVRLQTV